MAARIADGKGHSKHGIREVCELQAGFGEGAVQIIDGGYDQSHPFDRILEIAFDYRQVSSAGEEQCAVN